MYIKFFINTHKQFSQDENTLNLSALPEYSLKKKRQNIIYFYLLRRSSIPFKTSETVLLV